uniref:hypothetical protein n=1 Tax=Kocuria rhizophila TaxID=72000 RepID=UPI001C92DCEF
MGRKVRWVRERGLGGVGVKWGWRRCGCGGEGGWGVVVLRGLEGVGGWMGGRLMKVGVWWGGMGMGGGKRMAREEKK